MKREQVRSEVLCGGLSSCLRSWLFVCHGAFMESPNSIALPLDAVIPEDDPLWQAVLRAPLEDGPAPEEELRAIAGASEGSFLEDDVVAAQLILARP